MLEKASGASAGENRAGAGGGEDQSRPLECSGPGPRVWSAVTRRWLLGLWPVPVGWSSEQSVAEPSGAWAAASVHVLVDLLEQGVQQGLTLRLLQPLHHLGMLRDQLPQVSHFLQQLGEEVLAVGVVDLQVEF